jgi:hypothetical protein
MTILTLGILVSVRNYERLCLLAVQSRVRGSGDTSKGTLFTTICYKFATLKKLPQLPTYRTINNRTSNHAVDVSLLD